MAGIIDRFMVELGFVANTSGLKDIERQAEAAKSHLLSIGTAIQALVAGFAVKEIAKIGDEFEQNTIAIAGFFDALGVSTGGFDNAMAMAGTTMDQIVKDAARLPGEAEEYIEIFRAGLPVLREAKPDFSVKELTGFTNQLSAIAHTLKIPYEVTSREMQELFVKGEGHATRINVLFKRFLPFLRQVDGQQNLTQKSFNKMTEGQRVDLFIQSFAKLQPMLDRAASSFDAMWGAFVSGVKQVTRYGTQGLFDGMKKALDAFNGALFKADGTMTETAVSIVNGMGRIGRWIGNTVAFVVHLVEAFARIPGVGMAVKGTLLALGFALTGLAFEGAIGKVALFIKGLLDLKRLLMGGLFVAIFLVAEDLYIFSRGGVSVTGMLVNKLGPAGLWFSRVVLGGLVLAFARLRFGLFKTATAWMAANLPLTLAIALLAGMALAIAYVIKHWDEFSPAAKTAIVAVTAALGVLGAAFVAVKAQAIAAAVRAGVAWLVALGPIGLVVLALLAVIATVALVWAKWDAVTAFIREHPLLAGVMAMLQPMLAIIVGIIAIGKNWDAVTRMMGNAWDDLVDGLKDAWNSFAETINSVGIVTLPTFQARQPMLPAGEGVALPAEGPAEGAWQAPYASGQGQGAEGPTHIPTPADQIDNRDKAFAARDALLAPRERMLAPITDLAKVRNAKIAEAAERYRAAQVAANPPMVGAPAEGPAQAPYQPTAYMDAARAGAGSSVTNVANTSTTNNYVTNVASPKIEIHGAHNEEKTARAIDRHFTTIARRGHRSGKSKAAL